MSYERDENGVRIKYPDRNCQQCKNYPCFEGMENCLSNFAMYGCVLFEEK